MFYESSECRRCYRKKQECDTNPCSLNPITGHVRETSSHCYFMADADLSAVGLPPHPVLPELDPDHQCVILADCSCGNSYWVTEGGDEYGKLEAAHKLHVAVMREGC